MNILNEIALLKTQKEYFADVVRALSPTEIGYSELTSVIGPMLTVNATSLESILLLAENRHYRDVIILSRPFLEAVINVGYICAEGDKAIIASKKYAYQRGYRDLFQGIELNNFKIKNVFADHINKFEEAAPENLKQALSDYTIKGKKEVKQWTPETTKDKLHIVAKKYGEYVNVLLGFAFFTIYRDVSEIIHNSYYGVRIYLGMQQKDISAFQSSDEAAAFFTDHQERLATLILQQVNISVVALLKLLSDEFGSETVNVIYNKSNAALVKYTETAIG